MKNDHLKMLIVSALFAAIIAIAAQIVIKIPPVPFTAQTLAIMFTATILGKRYGTIAVTLYVFLGFVGLPVFNAGSAGIGKVFGPTGGFIIGFIPAAFFIGWYLEKVGRTISHVIVANVCASFFILVIGSVWLKFVGDLSWPAAFKGGMLPFIIPDALKAIVAAFIGLILYRRLVSANLLSKTSS